MDSPTLLEHRLDLLARAGVLLLENGAPTYRVNETVEILGAALGLEAAQVFATPVGFILEARMEGHASVRVRRITHSGVDMNRLARLDRLSRLAQGGQCSPDRIAGEIASVEESGRLYHDWLVVAGIGTACAALCVLLGGGPREAIAALVAGSLTMAARIGLRPANQAPVVVTVVAAFLATASGWLGCQVLGCTAPELASVAAVLQLIPGVPLVTSIVDLTSGDMLSALSRAAYALLLVVGVAMGMLLFLGWGL